MRVLKRRGMRVCAFKCGPDYVDAMYHKYTLSQYTQNIDLFFRSADAIRGAVTQDGEAADFAVIEGVMGFYDGMGGTSERSSTFHMSVETSSPAVLIVHARGITLTAAAIVNGLKSLRSPQQIKAVVLNQCSPTLYQKLAPVIERETGLPVLGYLPPSQAYAFPMRHLGLVMPPEISDFEQRMDALADQMEKTLDIDGLIALGKSAPDLAESPPPVRQVTDWQPVIAVAYDHAFHFYYDENLRLLEQMGARIVKFSPLHDKALPAGTAGLYLGGGYAEEYVPELSRNESMREAVRAALDSKMPVLAEGGGFLYLQKTMCAKDGTVYPMVGYLPGHSQPGHKRARFGYITVTAQTDNMLCKRGECIAAHEFHYWDTDCPGDAFFAQKPAGDRSWYAAVATETLYAGFPQLYLPNNPVFGENFVKAAAYYAPPAIAEVLPLNAAKTGDL